MTQGAGSVDGGNYPEVLSALTGAVMYNGGIGGESSTQIKDRMVADTYRAGWPVIIWAGRNNYTDPPTVEADVATMVAANGTSNYLVLSVLNSDAGGIGTLEYNDIASINASLSASYGAHYLDVREYLVSLYDPGNPTDVTDHTNDIPPSSLRVDTVHLNNNGYQDVANYVYAHRAELGL